MPDQEPRFERWKRAWRRSRRRLRITREGRIFLLLVLGVGVGAVNTGNNLLYLLLGAMLGTIVLSGVLAEIALRGIEIRRVVPPEIFATQETTIRLQLHNRKRYLPSFSLVVREQFGKKRELDEVHFVHLEPGGAGDDGYRCVFPRRGRCRFRGWSLETTFPFGLFAKRRFIDGAAIAIVYPRIDVALENPSLLGMAQGSGHHHRGHGEEFYALREYRRGDDYRRVAWKASARRGKLVTKEYSTGAAGAVVLHFANVCDDKRHPIFEAALDHAATIVAQMMERGHPVGLVTLEQNMAPRSGPEQFRALLEALALTRQIPAREVIERRSGERLMADAEVVVIATPWNSGYRPQRPDFVVVHVQPDRAAPRDLDSTTLAPTSVEATV